MTPHDVMIALGSAVAPERLESPQHPEAPLSPRAVVPLALLQAIQGGGPRAFDRGLPRASGALLPPVPERPRWARLLQTHTAWTARWRAAPTVWGVADRDGSALIPPLRAGRSPAPCGTPGTRHQRGRVGGTRCLLLPPWGWMGAWDGATAHRHAPHVHPRLAQGDAQRIGLTATGFQATRGAPANVHVCPRGRGRPRRRVAPVVARRPTVLHRPPVGPRVWASGRARMAWTRAAFTRLARGTLAMDDENMGRLSSAECSL